MNANSSNQEESKQTFFNSPTYGRLELPHVVQHILRFVNEKEGKYKLVLGTDSQAGAGYVEFVTAIVVHRVTRGGIYFWQRRIHRKRYQLRDRMYQEAMISIEAANELLKMERTFELFRKDFEIHVDVGQGGETKEMIAEIAGLVTGYGYVVRTKPDAFAATKVADRHNGYVPAFARERA